MADESDTKQIPVTSEKKKDPKRVEAGKRLAVLSRAARERKKKQVESNESSSGNSMITYIGVAIALISLVLAYKSNQREEKAIEPKYTPQTVTIVKQLDESKLDTLQ
jgi:nicotinic acid mononucleotide adenylyltransferase